MGIWWNGRHSCLRSIRRKPWGFKSLYPYHFMGSSSSSQDKSLSSLEHGCDSRWPFHFGAVVYRLGQVLLKH